MPRIDDFIDPSVGLMKWHDTSLPCMLHVWHPPWNYVDLAFMCMQVEVDMFWSRALAGQPRGRPGGQGLAGRPGGLAGRPGLLPCLAPF